jgi:hypothetical protein
MFTIILRYYVVFLVSLASVRDIHLALSEKSVCACVCIKRNVNENYFSQSVLSRNLTVMAVPWLRWLVAGFSPRRPGFAPGSVFVRFGVGKVALG